MPELARATALNNLEGKFLVRVLSYRFFFQPLTMSSLSATIMWYKAGISSGESCISASMVITTSPCAALNPSFSAADLP